jgi:hypothetical protein
VFFFWAGSGHIFGKDRYKLLLIPAHWCAATSRVAVSIGAACLFSRVTVARTPANRRALHAVFARCDERRAAERYAGQVGEGRGEGL